MSKQKIKTMQFAALFVILTLISAVNAVSRSDAYFGLHLDFHAVKENNRIGENVTDQMVQQVIDKVSPDYIQVDIKGHPGYSSYKTKVGRQTDGYVRDQLKIWRKVTKDNGISLVGHYSSVYDMAAIADNPEWAVIDYKGNRNARYLSLLSPFAQELMIPQIKELRRDYGLDAVWIDGECWGVQVDYNPKIVEMFKQKYGDVKIPATPSDKYYFEYLEILRQLFREYVKSYLREFREFDKDFQIASNWAYSTYMPEECELDLDWLSGDLPAANSINSARLEARFLRSHRKNWDLMSWGFFNYKNALLDTKTPIQLMQEAAAVISQGGGYQVYYTQQSDGSVRLWQIDKLTEVAKFCRDRQKFCHNAEPAIQTAVLVSTQAAYKMGASYRRVFGPWGNKETGGIAPVAGIAQALCNSQIPFEVMIEKQIIRNLDKLELIIIPEWDWLNSDFKDKLIEFANNGGSLLIVGAGATEMFEEQLGVDLVSEKRKETRWLEFENNRACFKDCEYINATASRELTALGKIVVFEQTGHMTSGKYLDTAVNHHPAATIRRLDKGMIAGIYIDFGKNYVLSRNCLARDFLKSVVERLLPEPIVKVAGSNYIDVVVNKLGDKLAVNLVNTAGPHGDNSITVFDEIPPIYDITVSIKTNAKPSSVVMQPEGIKLDYSMKQNYCIVQVPKLKLHQILVVD